MNVKALGFSSVYGSLPFHLDFLSFSIPVVVSTWQLDDPEELLILFSACSNTLPSSNSEPKSETTWIKSHLKLKLFSPHKEGSFFHLLLIWSLENPHPPTTSNRGT